MKDELVTLKTARLAKEKGFDYTILTIYLGGEMVLAYIARIYTFITKEDAEKTDKLFLAPTQSLLQKWLREKYNIHINITVNRYYTKDDILYNKYTVYYKKLKNDSVDSRMFCSSSGFETYEEALEYALFESLQII